MWWAKLEHALAGAAGALVSALLFGVVVWGAIPADDRRARRRLVVEGVLSLLVGALTAAYIAPALAPRVGADGPHELSAMAFAVGAVSWRVTPLVITGIEALARVWLRALPKPPNGPADGGAP